MSNRVFIENHGFMSQWCCNCSNRHIWHFKIYRDKKNNDKDFIEISMFQDNKANQLRKFYERKIPK